MLPYLARDLRIRPIPDLVHYGAPLWLTGTFLDPDYPGRVAEYAAAVAARYGSLVPDWTPLNEPLVHARFAGRTGAWPPHRRGERGFAALLVSLAERIARTIDGIRGEARDARIVHVEAVPTHAVEDPALEPAAAVPRAMPFLVSDLVEGRVGPSHPVHPWLLERGVPARRIEAFAGTRRRVDVWGVNWYPQMSHYRIEGSPEACRARRTAGTADDLAGAIEAAHIHTGRPVMVTETSVRGRPWARVRWLEAVEAMSARLVARGVPLEGVTWFPAMSLVSWDYRRGRRPPEAYLAHYGLWDLRPAPDGTLVRERTAVADAWEALLRRWG